MNNIKNEENNKYLFKIKDDYKKDIDEDDELILKIQKNRNNGKEKSFGDIFSKIFVRILGIASLILSIYYLYSLYEPFVKVLNERNTYLMLQIYIYGIVAIINLIAAINLIKLNYAGKILQFSSLLIFLIIKVFEIFYLELKDVQLNFAINSIIIAVLFIFILFTPITTRAL